MTDRNDDRRQARRVEATLKLEVQVPMADGSRQQASLETLNISSSGVYFKSDHFIEPMTKLEMMLELPVRVDGSIDDIEVATVPCEGIVVRVLPEEEEANCDDYEVAVFFTNIDQAGIQNLEEHIALLITTV